MKFLIFTFIAIHFFIFAEDVRFASVVKEEFLSPEIAHFDCHSSSIVETGKGLLCAVWKGGGGEGKSNIDMKKNVGVWSSLFNGKEWDVPKEIVEAADSVCWNPVLTKLFSGELLLFYRKGPDPRRTVSFLKRSCDGGMNWSKEEILPAGIIGPSKNKPLLLEGDLLLCPSSMSAGEPSDAFKATACWIDIFDSAAKRWSKAGPLEIPHRKFGVIEPVLFFDGEGHLKILCRDRAQKIGEKGFIWTATSCDGGLTWSELRPTDLPNPDSSFDVVDLGKGKILLIYNPSHVNRFPLALSLSNDGGDTWSPPLILEEFSGEFPAAILSSDGTIHLTYAYAKPGQEQRRIKHLVLDPLQLQ